MKPVIVKIEKGTGADAAVASGESTWGCGSGCCVVI